MKKRLMKKRNKSLAMLLSSALITSTVAVSTSAQTHVVQDGEHLTGIASKYNTTVEALTSANGIKNANFIRVNQVLTIPSAVVKEEVVEEVVEKEVVETVAPVYGEYVVVKNDNLSKIALKFNTTVEELVALNKIKTPNMIQIGDVLKVVSDTVAPEKGEAPEVTPAPEVVPEVEKVPEIVPEVEEAPEVTPEVEEAPEVTPEVEEAPEVTPEVEEAPEVTPEVEEAPEVTPEVEEEAEVEEDVVVPTVVTPSSAATKPSDILDFNNDVTTWKIQLPLFRDSQKLSVLESFGPEMNDGYSIEDIFYVDESDMSVVFYCSVDGAKTANTSYTRNELREQLVAGDNTTNWPYTGTHTLYTRTKVTEVPSTGRTITSQIHGIAVSGSNENPLVKVEYNDAEKAVKVALKMGTAATALESYHVFPDMDLDIVYDTKIHVTGGSVYVTISTNDSTDPTKLGAEYDGYREETYVRHFMEDDANWANLRAYFKAGNYVQDTSYDYEGEAAVVKIYAMDVFHDDVNSEYVAAESLTLDVETLTLAPDTTVKLGGEFAPIMTSNRGISWSVVSGDDVVAVDSHGNVTGIKEGSAVIRGASSENSSIYADVEVTVEAVEFIETVLIYSENFENGQPSSDDAYGKESSGMVISAKNGVTTSFDDGVFTLADADESETGRANFYFPAQETTTTISFKVRIDENIPYNVNKPQTARLHMDIGGREGGYLTGDYQAFRIRNMGVAAGGLVVDNSFVLSHALLGAERNSSAMEFELGQWKEVSMIITPDNGTADANTTSVYVDGLQVADKMANYVTTDFVNQICFSTGGEYQLSFSLEEVEVYSGIKIPEVSTVTTPKTWDTGVLPETMEMYDSVQILVNVTPNGANDAATYEVVDGDALSVNASGFVTAKAEGTGTIRVTSVADSSLSKDVTITVVDSVVRATGVSTEVTDVLVGKGETTTLDVTVTPSSATEKSVRYTILSGEKYISIDGNGVISGVEHGSAIVRVTSTNNDAAYVDVQVTCVSGYEDGDVIVVVDEFDGTHIDTTLWNTAVANVNNTVNEIQDGKLYFADQNTGGMPRSWATFAPQKDMFTVSFDVEILNDQVANVNTDAAAGSSFVVSMGNTDVTLVPNQVFSLRTTGDAEGNEVVNRRFAYATYMDEKQTNVYKDIADSAYALDTTYRVVITTTPDNGSATANTTSIYVNGKCVASALPNREKVSHINQVLFESTNHDLTTFTIDNFEVWAGDHTAK